MGKRLWDTTKASALNFGMMNVPAGVRNAVFPRMDQQTASAQPAGEQKMTNQQSSLTQGESGRRLTEEDLADYMRVGERKHVRDEKQKIIDAGGSPILTKPWEIVAFIRNAFRGKEKDVVKAYGRVNDRLAGAVSEATGGAVNVDGYYLELDANRIAHMKDHVGQDKDERNIPLTEEQIEQIPVYLDNFDDLLNVIRRKDGSVRLMLGKKINGHTIIVEAVSKGRKALHPVTAYQIDTSEYMKKYKAGAIGRSSTSRPANADTVDISRPAIAPVNASIPGNTPIVKGKGQIPGLSGQRQRGSNGGIPVVGWDGREVVKEATGPSVTVDGKKYLLLGYDAKGVPVYEDARKVQEQEAAAKAAARREASGDRGQGNNPTNKNAGNSLEKSEKDSTIIHKLTYDEVKTVHDYMSAQSYTINGKLREGIPLSKEETAFKDNLNEVLEKMPMYSGNLQRSLFFDDPADVQAFLVDYRPGAHIKYKEFISTTKGESQYNPEGQVQILIRGSKKGRDISSINEKEQEVLYKTDSEFVVKSISKRNGKYYIYLKEQ